MKHILLFFLILPILGFSQCPPDGTFTSQAEIDAFATDYPDCTILGVSLIISGDDITDLSGLGQITECTGLGIGGNLVLQNTDGLNANLVLSYVEGGTGNAFGIGNNASLLEITGLENLVNHADFESDFRISDNPMLISVEGVPNTFDSLNIFTISNNDALINLNGLEDYSAGLFAIISDNDSLIDLTGIGYFYGETVIISNNDNLQSLNGSELGGFDDYLIIENNQNLTDISAIYAGNYVDDGLIIRNNPNLSVCNTDNVCFFLYSNAVEEGIMFPGIFENNAPGCNSNFEVEYGCRIISNDDCGMFNYPLSSSLILGETIQATNELATTSEHTPSCNDVANRKDVWFVFDSGESATVDITVQAGFYLQLWDSNNSTYPECGNQTQVENACNSEALIDIPVISNNFYFVQVWNDDSADRVGSSWFDLTVQDGTLSTQSFQLEDIKIFPNPVNNVLNIQSNVSIDKVEIFDLLGQRIKELNLGSNTNTVDLSDLNDGMYLIQISINGKESTYKVLKK